MKHFFLLLLLVPFLARAQEQTTPRTQVVQGRITDAITKTPLPGAFVALMVQVGDSLKLSGLGTTTNEDGYYRLTGVPIGRATVKFGMLGYNTRTASNFQVFSGKEVVLNIVLDEKIVQENEVVITANQGAQKQLATNEFAFLSARGFDVEETRRYAGSRNDPSRMASNYAGVSGANDGRNDIIIRGNSPSGLLWRMEGADILNPSHFGTLGATGGPVSMLNNNVLEKSDFLTGAFPAEYGNALGGVFDLQMRAGNKEKREYVGQVGFNGFELGAEGPFKKGSKASYLVNARYSTLAAVSKLGVQFGTGTAVPYYQDVTFKVHMPTAKAGTFSLFGIGGSSNINFKGAEQDSTNLYSPYYQNSVFRTRSGVLGFQHNYQYSKNTWGQAVISTTINTNKGTVDSLINGRDPLPTFRNNSQNVRNSIRYTVGHRVNVRFSFKTGVFVDLYNIALNDSVLGSNNRFRTLRDTKADAWLLQGFIQGLYRVTDRLSATAGLYSQRFSYGQNPTLEPRAAVRYGVGKSEFSLATGLHSQIQPIQGYLVQTRVAEGQYVRTNSNLKQTRAVHVVAGFNRPLNTHTRIKTEAYFQHLYNAPIERRATDYSMLNEGADFNLPNTDSLVSKGLGRNMGIELTLERTFAQGYYFLITGSLFDSRYKASDGKWRNTAFNGQYITNVLAGKEWQIGKKSVFALDIKLTTAGGRRYSPVDVEKSRAESREVLVPGQAFSQQFKDYFRADVKFTYRLNGKHATQEFFVDLQNITNHENPYIRQYDVRRGREVTTNQLGLFPNVNYRINF